MGATNFIDFKKSTDAKSAFDELVLEAIYWHGCDAYNGTISTCELMPGVIKIADTWSEEAERSAFEFADRDDFGEKWYARALDCGKTDDGKNMYAFYGWASC